MTGSRTWTDWWTIEVALREEALKSPVSSLPTVVHGACPTGADSLADFLAERMGLPVERHPADWDTHGKSAGPIRNQQMVDLGADVCLAFPLPDSRGTRHCMAAAERAGIPVRVFEHLEGAKPVD